MKIIINWIVAITAPVLLCSSGGEYAAEAVAGGRRVARAELADGRYIERAELADGRDVERAELVMGTVARVALPASIASVERFTAAFAAFRDVDDAMSLYRPASELSRVNARAGDSPEPVDDALFALLSRARDLAVESDGAFDVTILPLLRLWGAYPGLASLPPGSVTAVGASGLRLDPRARTVSFARRGMGIDLGGIAKGFALDRARAALAAEGVARARLDLGGQLAFVGGDPAGWRVAVRDPEEPGRTLGVLTLDAGASVSTSGNYARDFAAEGWRARSHIYDPRTGRPVTRDVAVTAWTPDATTADALSTALVVLGRDSAADLLAREPSAGALFSEGRGAGRRLTIVGRPPRDWTVSEGERAVAGL